MRFTNVCVQCFALLVTIILLVGNYQDADQKKAEWKIMSAILWTNSIMLLCFIIAWLCEGNPSLEVINIIVTSGKFGIGYILGICYTLYIWKCLEIEKNNEIKIIYGNIAICLIACVLCASSIFNGIYYTCKGGIYQRGPFFYLNQLLAVVVVIPDMILILMHRKKAGSRKIASLISYGILPVLGAIIQILYKQFDVICLATTLAILIIYLVIYVDQKRERMDELMELKMKTMYSQMNPHFIYNTLSLIQDMCYGKAPDAEETVVQFSEFLRVTIDSVNKRKMIPFEEELNHTKNYLKLEQKRFGKMLSVNYDIKVTNFLIPSLKLQPIVENAVYHGIMKLEQGGSLLIGVSYDDDNYIITVKDNGIGFDNTEEICTDGENGISNIGNVLKYMCSGTISVKSKKDSGTVAVIKIPKKGES